MKISALETIRVQQFPNILWVKIHTDDGLVGLGETFFGAQAVEAYIHEEVAPKLIGRDPLAIEQQPRHVVAEIFDALLSSETREQLVDELGQFRIQLLERAWVHLKA